jgi:tripartite-type tricarboxylate transporter receptor subunit TctC
VRLAGRRAALWMTGASVAAAALVRRAASQPAWPLRPLRIVVPFTENGTLAAAARILASPLATEVGADVFVEYRPGAGGAVGTTAVARTDDNHTFLFTSISFVINSAIGRPFYRINDLVPVTSVATLPVLIIAPTSSPLPNLRSIIERAREQPGRHLYGSGGVGTVEHLAGESLCALAGIEMSHVPYRGTSAMLAELDKVPLLCGFASLTSVHPHNPSEAIKVVAVTTRRRIAAFPNIPTVEEAGPVPGYGIDPWAGLFAPPGVPSIGVQKVRRAVDASLREPAVRQMLAAIGAVPSSSSSETFAQLVSQDAERFTALAQRRGIRSD